MTSEYVRKAATLILNFYDKKDCELFTAKDVESWWVYGDEATRLETLRDGHLYEPFPFCGSVIMKALRYLLSLKCIERTSSSGSYRFLTDDAHTRMNKYGGEHILTIVELHHVFQTISEETKCIPRVEIIEHHGFYGEKRTELTFQTNIKHERERIKLPPSNNYTTDTIYSFTIPPGLELPFPIHSQQTVFDDNGIDD